MCIYKPATEKTLDGVKLRELPICKYQGYCPKGKKESDEKSTEVKMDKKYEFVRYSVGEKLENNLKEEGASFETYDNMCQCTIRMNNITDAEREAVESGRIICSLVSVNDVTYICMYLGNVLYYEMPFNMGLYKEFRLDKLEEGNGYLFFILLADHDSGIIKAMRAVGLSDNFSRILYNLSVNQWNNKIDDYDKRVAEIFEKYPTTTMLKNSLVYDVFGGAL